MSFVWMHVPAYMQDVGLCYSLYICVSDHWTVTSLADGMMAVIMTFQRAPIET